MVFDAERDRALIFYGLIHAEPGDFNFRGVGQSIALWERFEDEPTRPEVSPTAEHPTLLFEEGEPPWGTAAVIEGEDLFVFACHSDETASRNRARDQRPRTAVLPEDPAKALVHLAERRWTAPAAR